MDKIIKMIGKEGLRNPWLSLSLLGLLLFVLAWFTISPLLFFTNDTGLRYLQVRELAAHHWQTFAVDYPARFLDPYLQHTPYYYAYVVVKEQIYLSISPLFPLIGSLLWSVIGRLGLVILPVAGGLATAGATYRLSQQSGLSTAPIVLWATLLATPLLFYSLEFWDHTFVTAFALWGIVMMAKGIEECRLRPIGLGAVLLAVAWVQRPEFAVFAAAAGGALILVTHFDWRAMMTFCFGNLLGAAPFWLLQYRWFGNPLGIVYGKKLLGYGVPDSYPYIAYSDNPDITRSFVVGRLLTYVESRDPLTFGATLLGLFAIAVIVFALRVPRWQRRSILVAGFVLSFASYGLWLVKMSGSLVTGILPTFTLLPLSLAVVSKDDAGGRQTVYRFVLATALVFLAAMVLVWPAFGGKQWGSRYLLPFYPLLLYLAFYSSKHYRDRLSAPLRQALILGCGGLLLAGLLVQLAGVHQLVQRRAGQRRLRELIQSLPAELILTNNPFLPSVMSSLEEKMFLYIDGEEDFETLVPRMEEHGIDRFAVAQVEGLPVSVPGMVDDVVLDEIEPSVFELVPRNGSGSRASEHRPR